MVIISHNRAKCIGCNYCVELAFAQWRMSKKDGKATLLHARERKGMHTAKVGDEDYDDNVKAAQACPVNIIQVKKI